MLSNEDIIERIIEKGEWAYKKLNRSTPEGRKLTKYIPTKIKGEEDIEFSCWREYAVYKMGEQLKDYIPFADITCTFDLDDSTIEIAVDDNELETLNKKLLEICQKLHLT